MRRTNINGDAAMKRIIDACRHASVPSAAPGLIRRGMSPSEAQLELSRLIGQHGAAGLAERRLALQETTRHVD